MMTPREPVEVARLIASGRWQAKHIASYHQQFGDAVLLAVLTCPFLNDCSSESLTHYDCQQATGKLLLAMMPECDRPLRQMLRQSLSLWNVSVEEWPYFLCRRYGIDAVAEAIDRIAESDPLSETEQRSIETLRFWLRAKRAKILGAFSSE